MAQGAIGQLLGAEWTRDARHAELDLEQRALALDVELQAGAVERAIDECLEAIVSAVRDDRLRHGGAVAAVVGGNRRELADLRLTEG